MNEYKEKNIKDPIFDKSNWIGMFYYNPDDKRIFPPNRTTYYLLGFGWSINYANRKSVIAWALIYTATILMIKFHIL